MERPGRRCDVWELEDKHRGQDVYVIGAGPSAGYIEAEFFRNKVSIGVNEVYQRFPVSYTVRKESWNAQQAYESGYPMIVSRHTHGSLKGQVNAFEGDYDWYAFEHLQNGLEDVDVSVIDMRYGKVVVSYSTITSAMHVAAIMGAANIILVGHDCGTLDGQVNYPGYHESPYGADFYRKWIGVIESQTAAVRDKLREVFGVRVYSLNPFLNFGLEGHKYAR